MRKDIPIADQVVQCCHVSIDCGNKFDIPENCHMVLIGVENQENLLKASEHIASKGIDFIMFFEPDDDMHYTALCTEPINGDLRKVFRKYKMWTM